MIANLRINPVYDPLYELPTAYNPNYQLRFIRLHGGAGSGKSVCAAHICILRALQGGRVYAFRKVGRTVKLSIFQELKDGIEAMGLDGVVRVNKSEYFFDFPGGGFIACGGLDEREKIKSISNPSLIWMEEATEFDNSDFIQLNTRLRSPQFQNFLILSYNPISAQSWIKKHFEDTNDFRETQLCLKTTYKDNKFLTEDYGRILEGYAAHSPEDWAVYAKGEWGERRKGLIFRNWKLLPEWPEDLPAHKTTYGVDFGWNDPNVLIRTCLIDEAELYVQELSYRSFQLASDFAASFPGLGVPFSAGIYCDHAPANISLIQSAGYGRAMAAAKAKPGDQLKLMQKYNVYICGHSPNIVREMQEYEWAEDRNGKIEDVPKNNQSDHAIDAIRYAIFTGVLNKGASGVSKASTARPPLRLR